MRRVVTGHAALDVVARCGKIQQVFESGARGCTWDVRGGMVRCNGKPMDAFAGKWLDPLVWNGNHIVIREPLRKAK